MGNIYKRERRGELIIACLIAIESRGSCRVERQGGVFGSGHLGRTYGTDNTPLSALFNAQEEEEEAKDIYSL